MIPGGELLKYPIDYAYRINKRIKKDTFKLKDGYFIEIEFTISDLINDDCIVGSIVDEKYMITNLPKKVESALRYWIREKFKLPMPKLLIPYF